MKVKALLSIYDITEGKVYAVVSQINNEHGFLVEVLDDLGDFFWLGSDEFEVIG